MAKRLEMTDEIQARIHAAAGSEIDVTKVVVFETVAANTRPLSKRGSIFHKGVIDASLLAEMAGIPAQGGVPLHNMHLQGMEHPVGKTFYAGITMDDMGQPELRAQFYLPLTEVDLISKLDTGVIDEVSVGIRPKHIFCSACSFDYASDKATMMNFFDQVCENDHTIGKDGVHVQLKGLDRWMELSLVSAGAADKPKIVGRTKALLGADDYQKLAATGKVPDATTLFATVKDQPMSVPDFNKLVTDLTASAGQVATLTAANATLTANAADLTARLAAAEAKVTELTAANTGPAKQVLDLTATNTALTAEIDETKVFLTDQLKAASVALGKPLEDKDIPADVKGLVAALKATTESVHKLIPINGVSGTVDSAKQDEARFSAFKTSK
jgi:hypothetical protein